MIIRMKSSPGKSAHISFLLRHSCHGDGYNADIASHSAGRSECVLQNHSYSEVL
ncbi:hypothetical protein EDC90_103224 [Martelella mediterranea]|uniref:Uncharacterized protein n=1 Tax=Martelella mediterranea TaxID=293089 RepID=A0A4R3NI83_9HYPH|nr:hypothetical protein EDC90_103224 [Martelella mediterranea]